MNDKKTFPMTCIICPMGCTMEVTTEGEGANRRVVSVTDNGCKRGPEYVEKELLNPTRTLTTTITVQNGDLTVVPVKTAGEVPKNMLLQCMEVIRRATVKAPIKTGDVLLHDILGTGVNVVSCARVNKK
ncbi:hypothetical protein MSI_15730 [Treponema sp. JC4]|uniref:DUF1667 domain-containing protein n=1 Tax=Treponema sp. JC4 TaxID=1124982 RepID=UPI00025B0C50|nr:DUF1667 domain-containing protein [Treponema sp. JC4]EID84977.1 hypothetical protein MSI_15730 [Treponema sp. JC4]